MSEATLTDDIDLLRSQVSEVILPGEPAYDAARATWNLSVDQHPAVVVVARSAEEVAATVRFAERHNLGVAVQATGHGTKLPADDALLLITAMQGVRVDPEGRKAWVGAGTKWKAVLEEAQRYGLAPLLGSSSEVGAIGFTLGGGMGWLARKYGLSCDSVLSFEMVDITGRIMQLSPGSNPALFWAMRGGGGAGLGVVTSMEIQLYPVSTVYAGNLLYPPEMAHEVMARWAAWVRDVPEELTSAVVIMNFPPLPIVPPELQGKSFVMVRGCYCGDVGRGEELIDSWRAWRRPLMDFFHDMPFVQSDMISQDPVDPIPVGITGAWMREITHEAIDAIIRYTLLQGGPHTLLFAEIRHAGGAISRVGAEEAAFSHRHHPFSLEMVGITPTPEAHEHFLEHTEGLRAEIAPCLPGDVYINFLEGEEAMKRTPSAFSIESYQRLKRLKAAMDPENTFRYGLDIPPLI
mgnify:FL=1